MEFSRRLLGKALLLSGTFGSFACSRKGLRAGGYREVELDGGMARLRLPDNFEPLRGEQIRKRSRWVGIPNGPGVSLKGDVVLDLMQMNFWAVSHVFGMGEAVDSEGRTTLEAMLVVSRLADAQAFAPAHAYADSSRQYSPDARWKGVHKLEWRNEAKGANKAEMNAAPQAKRFRISEAQVNGTGLAVVLEDREKLMETMLLASGPPTEHPKLLAAMKDFLREATSSYVLRQPLDEYFRQINAAIEAMAAARRLRYIELLQTLQNEGLDYSPTPQLVRFNKNLVCRFFWPAYDRSGVPLDISFAARLGRVLQKPSEEMQRAFQSGQLLVLTQAEQGREASLARDAGWVEEGMAIATLSFSFSEEIPDFSLWLDEVEAASKKGLAQGLWELAN